MQPMKTKIVREPTGETRANRENAADQATSLICKQNSIQPSRKFIRLATACREYDTPRSNWYRAFERGELTRYKRGSTVYLDIAEIESWITGNPIRTC